MFVLSKRRGPFSKGTGRAGGSTIRRSPPLPLPAGAKKRSARNRRACAERRLQNSQEPKGWCRAGTIPDGSGCQRRALAIGIAIMIDAMIDGVVHAGFRAILIVRQFAV